MMNNSLAHSITEFLLIVFTCGFTVAFSHQDALASTVQGKRFNETPDPYFNQPTTAKAAPSQTPEPGVEFVSPNLTPPAIVSNTQTQSPDLTQPEIWNAPLTPVRATKQPTSIYNVVPPAVPIRSKSIIRENQSFGVQNDFALKPIDSENEAQPRSKRPPLSTNAFPSKSNDFRAGLNSQSKSSATPVGEWGNATPSPSFTEIGNSTKSARDLAKSPTKTDSTDQPQPFEPTKVIALVGGEPIFVGDMLFEINQLIEQFMPQAPPEIKEQERQKMIPKMTPKFVEQKMLFMGAIRLLPEGADIEAVLEQAGKEFDNKALDKMIENSGIKSVAEFDAHLRVQGSSLRKLRRAWSTEQLTKYFLSQQLNVATEVTHQELLDNYRKNHEAYAVPARSRWEQVMIRFDRLPSRDEAKTKLVEMGNQIVYGANLAAVAKKSSHGFRADGGGQHDWTTRGALVLKEIDEAIFMLPVGELSDIIETRDGYHVVRVIERTAATHKPFLEAQVKIKERILSEKRNAAYEKHLAKLKDEIPVEYFLNQDVASKPIGLNSPRTAQR